MFVEAAVFDDAEVVAGHSLVLFVIAFLDRAAGVAVQTERPRNQEEKEKLE